MIRDPTGKTLKPDILVLKGEALAVDVTVRNVYDKDKTLQKAAKEKRQKYRPLKDEICKLLGVRNVTFYGLPLGSKGKWYKPNNKLLSKAAGGGPSGRGPKTSS